MPEPSKIPAAWAWDGDINNIPATDPGNGLASWELGYPIETQTPIASGGVPPRRQDMNGALNALSNHSLWYQQGGLWEYDAYTDYEIGNEILENGSLYYCIAANGPSGTVKSPAQDTAETYWKPIIFANGRHPDPDHLLQPAVLQVLQAVYPVGSIYCSYGSTSPATLFGFGSWTKIEGRFLLGANATYGLGSTGGSATVTLTVNQIPAHNHSASTSSAGSHTHTATTASAGAHTHSVSGTAASAGNHTHTITVNSGGAHSHTASSNSTGAHTHSRGTMNITGTVKAGWSDEGPFPGNVVASGAFTSAPTGGNGADGSTAGGAYDLTLDASRSWTGATSSAGAHSHTITVNNGGAHAHTASAATTGAHTHTVSGTAASAGAHTHTMTVGSAGAHTHSVTVGNTGGSQSHTNMPPYLAVSMWRRTA
jgi:microcystin-dependent protein